MNLTGAGRLAGPTWIKGSGGQIIGPQALQGVGLAWQYRGSQIDSGRVSNTF